MSVQNEPAAILVNSGQSEGERGLKKFCFACLFFFWAATCFAAPVHEVDYSGLIGKIGAEKGKVVVVNFWATWCLPCRMEIPDLIKIRNQFSEKDVAVFGVSIDQEIGSITEFSRLSGINYTLLHARDDVSIGFELRGIPRTVIYNRKEEKVVDRLGAVEFASLSGEISKLLKD